MNIPEKVIKHIKEKWIRSNCVLCNANDWNVNSYIFELPGKDTTSIPLVTAWCGNCGNTILISAVVAGIV